MVPLARRNLLAEKGRLAMSIAGVAFAVLLVLVVVSLYRGWSDVGRLYQSLPGDIWVSQPGTSDPFHSTSFLPASDGARVASVEGVRGVLPVYARHIAFDRDGRELDVFAIALAASAGSGLSGSRYFPRRGEIDVDRVLAVRAGVGLGDTLDVLGRRLRVTRIHSGGNSIFQTAFLNADDARTMFGTDRLVNFFLVDLRRATVVDRVRAAIERALPGAETHTSEQFAESFADRVNSGFLAVVGVLVGIGFVVGGAVIALTTYTATLERAREYGVLKAIGASDAFLSRVVVQQSLLVGTAGSLLGVAVSAATTTLVERAVPEFITELRAADVASVLAGALLTAIVAAYVPVQRLIRLDPAMVFRP